MIEHDRTYHGTEDAEDVKVHFAPRIRVIALWKLAHKIAKVFLLPTREKEAIHVIVDFTNEKHRERVERYLCKRSIRGRAPFAAAREHALTHRLRQVQWWRVGLRRAVAHGLRCRQDGAHRECIHAHAERKHGYG